MNRIWALKRRHDFNEWRKDYRAGLVASILANVNRAEGAPTFTPMYFFPQWQVAEQPVEGTEQDPYAGDRVLYAMACAAANADVPD